MTFGVHLFRSSGVPPDNIKQTNIRQSHQNKGIALKPVLYRGIFGEVFLSFAYCMELNY